MHKAEKGHRLFKCAGDGCALTLRITVTHIHYGKTFDVPCKACGTVNRVAIPVPPPEPEPLRPAGGETSTDIFDDLFSGKKRSW